MSADRWSECPKCVATAQQDKMARLIDLDEQEQKALDAYGKVPLEEWQALQKEANEARADFQLSYPKYGEETFREDYEIYWSEHNEIYVTWSGSCTNCGLTSDFQYVHKIEY